MKKPLIIAMGLLAVVLFAFPETSKAQVFRGGRPGIGIYFGSGGYNYGPYSNYGYPGYPYFNNAYPFYNPYTGSGYYYGQNYNSPTVPPGLQAFYYQPPGRPLAAPPRNSALVRIKVPNPAAKVWIENQPTGRQGLERDFVSPPLEPGYTYTYTIRAQWQQNGKMMDQTRNVDVRKGQQVSVDFNQPQKQK